MSCKYCSRCDFNPKLVSAVGDYIFAFADITADGRLRLYADGDSDAVEYAEVNYCPMCGRKLKGDAE